MTVFSRRDTIAMSLAGLALSACRGKEQGGASVLKVGSQRGGTKALLLASGELKGLPFTVEWSEFPAAQTLMEAVGSGAIDMGLAGDAPFLFAYQSGRPIKAVRAQVVQDRPERSLAILVPAKSPAHSLAELKGKRVATGKGSIGHYLLLRALAVEGLRPDHVQIVFLSPSDAKAALQSGAIDGWSTWVPYVSVAVSEGYRVLVDGKELVTGIGFEVASEAAIAGKRAIMKQFLEREARALLWAKTHPDSYADVLAKETGLPRPIARDMVIRNARLAVPFSPDLIKGEQTVIDTFRAAGEIKGDRPLADAFVTL
ncbi:MAG TPA: ABC transporter substrate-binding protein [Sphingobium sp.]|uniref:ABC transporter substrate-binding protein n=1 Tax=Sphingobium sp. TaxID=1912891 RepID=UPI002ED095E9